MTLEPQRSEAAQGVADNPAPELLLIVPQVDFSEDTGHELVELRKSF